ncbi:MAG: alginate O-acetyltransferase complex protein AlgI [Paracoccaceae bacterium]|jgi:alginate O-acetyltransferase complex protein AlgI
MLFQSVEFLFLFLPFVWVGFVALHLRVGLNAALSFLVAASAFFYAWHTPHYLTIVVASICVNFVIGKRLSQSSGRVLLGCGIAFNLGLLIVFKYADFVVENLNVLRVEAIPLPAFVLPLAISFYTFQQIAYLIDVSRGHKSVTSFLRYAFFVGFFPQLIAGPIVHHHEILPQLQRLSPNARRLVLNLCVGLTIFFLGLAKKLLIADNVGEIADDIFDKAGPGNVPTFVDCWYGAVAFTFQIYFDFSGYSDMAIGLGRMFGIRLPLNFYSPYKATSIIDFWRRWHITLSRFLRDYLYFGLGGNRRGPLRRYINILIVMLLGGLWHGAAWAFLLWGGLHGIYIVVNHLWRRVRFPWADCRAFKLVAWGLTFVAIIIAWIPFRVNDLGTALAIYTEMAGLNGLNMGFARYLSVGDWRTLLLNFGFEYHNGSWFLSVRFWMWVGAFISFFMPNIYQWMRWRGPVSNMPERRNLFGLDWSPNFGTAILVGGIGVLAIVYQSRPVEFLYFQF